MSDDDSDGSSSEDLIGTRIVTEQAAEHLPARERVQRARDNPLVDVRGKPRFHGAFTGGFTAGYYNSVGSKEGWAPSEWRSSRDERAGTSRSAGLRPEDFMDEEDLADVHKAKALVVQEEFQRPAQGAIGGRAKGETSSSGGGAPSRLAEVFSVRSAPSGRHRAACSMQPAWPGALILPSLALSQRNDTLVLSPPLPAQIPEGAETTGFLLLRQLGWKDGFGVGARIKLREDDASGGAGSAMRVAPRAFGSRF